MSDDAERCQYCGGEFSPRGLSTHERHCDESDEQTSDGASVDTDRGPEQTPSEYSEVALSALERDEHTCVHCGSVDDVLVHTVDPEADECVANLITLCPDCDEEFADYRPLTKRTEAWH